MSTTHDPMTTTPQTPASRGRSLPTGLARTIGQTALAGVLLLALGCATEQQSSSTAPRQILATNEPAGPASEGAIPEGPIGTDPGAPAINPVVDLTDDNTPVWSVVPAQVIDTRALPQPIQDVSDEDGVPQGVKSFIPKHTAPTVPVVPPNDLEVDGGLLDEPRASGALNIFDGIGATGFIPPDPNIAVGPDHVVQVVNTSIAFYTKSGSLEFQSRLGVDGNPGFFEDVGAGDFVFDPKCFYDHYSQRFVVVALEVYGLFPDDPRPDGSFVTIAVSDDDDPNGVWYKYRTNALTSVGNEMFWWDYPGFGYDNTAWYVNANLFNIDFFGSPGIAGVGYRVFDKAAMLNGDPAVFATLRDADSFSMQGTQHFGGNDVPYFLGFNNTNTLRVSAITDPLTSPSIVSTTVSVPAIRTPGLAQTSGNALDTVRLRIMNVQWRNGSLYGAHAIGRAESGRNIARWYEINTNDWPFTGSVTLEQSGEIDPGAGVETFFPSIYSNALGEVAMVFGRSAPDERVSFYVTARGPSDPPGFMGSPIELAVSPADVPGSDGSRWGDYYGIALDPVDNTTFWGVGQVQATSSGGGWGTVIAELGIDTGDGQINLSLASDLPAITEPGVDFPVQVLVTLGNDELLRDPRILVTNDDSTVDIIPMDEVSPGLFEGVIPGPTCNKDFAFSFDAVGASSGTVILPDDGSRFSVDVGEGEIEFVDSFEDDLGWTVTGDATDGQWDRGVPLDPGPEGDPRGAPTSDFDGSGSCYLTDNTLGNTDVDAGETILTSPNMKYEGLPSLSYARWFHTTTSTDPDSDAFVVEVSADNGASWTLLETVGPGGPETSGGWIQKTFSVADIVPITGQLRVRFIASDDENPSVIEAGVDAVQLSGVVCCPADWNMDGRLDMTDFVLFVQEWTAMIHRTDVNEDGRFDILDVVRFFFAWSLGCDEDL